MIIAGGACIGKRCATSWKGEFIFSNFTDLADLRRQMEENPEIATGNLENFRRAGHPVRQAQLLSLLTLSEAKLNCRERLAVYCVNGEGCLQTNAEYWQDYVENGKVMGRSALFVGTLTSTAPCEAAITINSHGPVEYRSGELAEILQQIDYLIDKGKIAAALVMELENDNATGLLFVHGKGFVVGKEQKLADFFEKE